MRRRRIGVLGFLVCLGIATTALAQWGHPLKGQWSGDWGPNASTRNRVLLDLNWDGKAATGVINPGSPNAITLGKITAEPEPTWEAWTVRMEGPGGVIIEGKMVNIGSANRTMSGTWTQGGTKGDFKLTRN